MVNSAGTECGGGYHVTADNTIPVDSVKKCKKKPTLNFPLICRRRYCVRIVLMTCVICGN